MWYTLKILHYVIMIFNFLAHLEHSLSTNFRLLGLYFNKWTGFNVCRETLIFESKPREWFVNLGKHIFGCLKFDMSDWWSGFNMIVSCNFDFRLWSNWMESSDISVLFIDDLLVLMLFIIDSLDSSKFKHLLVPLTY